MNSEDIMNLNVKKKIEKTLKFPGIGWVDTYQLEEEKEILIWEDGNLDRFVLIIGPIMDQRSKEIMRKVTLQFIKQIDHYIKSHED